MAAISLGIGGIAGWRILQRTEDRQIAAVSREAGVQKSQAYFRERLSEGVTAEELVGDYRMLSVALGAFGLEGDLPNKAFIRKILESDLSDNRSLVNRLSDKRYLKMAQALRIDDPLADTAKVGQQVSDAYLQREFERRVGEGDGDLRLAMNARRELADFAGRTSGNKTLWYEVMGNTPLRKMFETAFGFRSSFGQLPVDRQLEEFMGAAERVLGTSSLREIASKGLTDKLITNFLVRSTNSTSVAQNRYSAALTLLSR